MNKEAIIKRAMALLEKRSQVIKEPSEEMQSCLSLYRMAIKCVMETIPDYEGQPNEEILMSSTVYKYFISEGGLNIVCDKMRDRVTKSSLSEQEQQECLELIGCAEAMFNEHIAERGRNELCHG